MSRPRLADDDFRKHVTVTLTRREWEILKDHMSQIETRSPGEAIRRLLQQTERKDLV